MIISLDASAPDAEPILMEPDNFRALKAVVAHASAEAFTATKRAKELGRWDGDHFWISPQHLIRLASAVSEPDEAWHEGFQQMLSYAGKSGWVDNDGQIRVHVEYV